MRFRNEFVLSWPLLGKELLELAARKRTYVTRVVYAAIFFIVFWMMYISFRQVGYGPSRVYSMLGSGTRLFDMIVGINFYAIYILLPAMMAGVITYEKERDSLHLLLLTDLRPWEILLQKYFSRLLPMFSFVLMSVPLLGLAFSFGGVSSSKIFVALLCLILTCLQIGAYSLMISSFCRTTSSAILFCYLGYAVFLGIIFLCSAMIRDEPDFLWHVFGMAVYFDFGRLISISGPICISITILFYLFMARRFLVARAFVPAKDVIKNQYAKLDKGFDRINKRVGRGVTFGESGQGVLPDDRPVSWRELTKHSLGNPRYVVRHILCLWIPVVLIVLGIIMHHLSQRSFDDEVWQFSFLLMFMWPIALLMIAVAGVNLVSAERSNQSLEVLASTPLAGAHIVREKMLGMRRFMWVLGGAFTLVFLAEAWMEMESEVGGRGRSSGQTAVEAIVYFIFSELSLVVYFPMVAWLAMLCGLKYKKRTKATLSALAFLLMWMFLPLAFFAMLMIGGLGRGDEEIVYLLLSSPVMMPVMTELGTVFDSVDGYIVVPGVLNYLWYFGAVTVLKGWCLGEADRYLGRADNRIVSPVAG